MRQISKTIGLSIIVALASPIITSASERPNLLLILADDLGYGDLGMTGSQTIPTPNIDGLASRGIFCPQAYVASSVCSPSRAGLLTGRDPRRFGYEGNLNNDSKNYATRPELLGLPPSEHTLADHLRAAGYSTALVGKWHLGMHPTMHPNRRGFDHFCGILSGSHTYWIDETSSLERNGEPLRQVSRSYMTDLLTDEAIAWLDQQSESTVNKPWFLFASYTAPHTPLEATPDDLKIVESIGDPKRRTYAAMVHGLDRNVGRLLSKIEQLGQQENTLVVFLSDNGGATDNGSWNADFSGAKGCLREGGVRVPMIWSWPGRLPQGKQTKQVVSSLDILPTFVQLSGGRMVPAASPPSHHDPRNERVYKSRYGAYDGIDVLPVLTGSKSPQPRQLFWRLQGQVGLLQGEYKVLRPSHRMPQLFHMPSDRSEAADLVSSEAGRTAAMLLTLADWEAALPTVPLWDSSPYWWGETAKIYDTFKPRPEPK